MNKLLNKGISTPIAIAIIIAVAVLAGAGVLAYQYYYLPKEKIDIPVFKDTIPEPSQTKDWKTYTNEEYGFQIQYPKDYKTQEIPISSPTGISVSLEKGSVSAQEINNSIINIDLPQDCMFNSKELEDKNMLSFKDIKKINGVNFYHYINYNSMAQYLGGYCGMSAGCVYKDVYRTLYNNHCYQIVYDRNSEEIPEVFNQILSTFEFIK